MIANDSHAVFLTATRTCFRVVLLLVTTCCDHSELSFVIVCATSHAFDFPFRPQTLLVFQRRDRTVTLRIARVVHNLSTGNSRCFHHVSYERRGSSSSQPALELSVRTQVEPSERARSREDERASAYDADHESQRNPHWNRVGVRSSDDTRV